MTTGKTGGAVNKQERDRRRRARAEPLDPNMRLVVTFVPTIAGVDHVNAIRAVAKFALGRFGLRAVDNGEVKS
jgi:hypothetical protein